MHDAHATFLITSKKQMNYIVASLFSKTSIIFETELDTFQDIIFFLLAANMVTYCRQLKNSLLSQYQKFCWYPCFWYSAVIRDMGVSSALKNLVGVVFSRYTRKKHCGSLKKRESIMLRHVPLRVGWKM